MSQLIKPSSVKWWGAVVYGYRIVPDKERVSAGRAGGPGQSGDWCSPEKRDEGGDAVHCGQGQATEVRATRKWSNYHLLVSFWSLFARQKLAGANLYVVCLSQIGDYLRNLVCLQGWVEGFGRQILSNLSLPVQSLTSLSPRGINKYHWPGLTRRPAGSIQSLQIPIGWREHYHWCFLSSKLGPFWG